MTVHDKWKISAAFEIESEKGTKSNRSHDFYLKDLSYLMCAILIIRAAIAKKEFSEYILPHFIALPSFIICMSKYENFIII
ncbi:MAG: hypothetical protein KAT25_00175 [Sulfuriflexus sp.]|nr:hypothetical protein [Sulfuriflexus sp.]